VQKTVAQKIQLEPVKEILVAQKAAVQKQKIAENNF
jgi:hypothetical protein